MGRDASGLDSIRVEPYTGGARWAVATREKTEYATRVNKYGIPLADLPAHCLDAVDAAERSLSRTLIVKDGHAVAAIVPMVDLDRIDPPDPAVNGADPLLALAGGAGLDEFVDSLEAPAVEPDSADLSTTHLYRRV